MSQKNLVEPLIVMHDKLVEINLKCKDYSLKTVSFSQENSDSIWFNTLAQYTSDTQESVKEIKYELLKLYREMIFETNADDDIQSLVTTVKDELSKVIIVLEEYVALKEKSSKVSDSELQVIHYKLLSDISMRLEVRVLHSIDEIKEIVQQYQDAGSAYEGYVPTLLIWCGNELDIAVEELESMLNIDYANADSNAISAELPTHYEKIYYVIDKLKRVNDVCEDAHTFFGEAGSKISDAIRAKLGYDKSVTALLSEVLTNITYTLEELQKYDQYITLELMEELSFEAITIEHKRIISRSAKMIQDDIKKPLMQCIKNICKK